MVEIRRQLTDTRNKSLGTNGKVGIAIHETANTGKGANAQAHANLQSKGNARQASWHWQVDDEVAIQSLSHNVRAWHAGKAHGNNNYIAIEICVNSDGDYVQACKNAAELVRHIRSEGVGSDLKQHNAFSGKNCPTGIRQGRDGVTWDVFRGWVENGVDSDAPAPQPSGGSSTDWNGPFSSDYIRDVQFKLNKLGYNLAIDGSRGPATQGAIKDFQSKNGLTVDASPGPATMAKLNAALAPAPAPAPAPTRPNVRELQDAVGALKDNSWGPDSDKRLEAVRQASGLHGEKFPFGVRYTQAVVRTKVDGDWGRNSVSAHDDTVKRIQVALRSMGFYNGAIDGNWGPATERAYQAARAAAKR